MLGGLEVEMEMGEVTVGELETLEIAGEEIEFVPVSVGNPHAVIRRDPERSELLRLGPLVERHPRFPERTNVQLVYVDRSPRDHGRRLGARRGGDAFLGHQLGRGRRRRRSHKAGARARSRCTS